MSTLLDGSREDASRRDWQHILHIDAALLFGLLLGWASQVFAVESDPIVEKIDALLPQTQCAQCGYPGCRPYAEAIAAGAALDLCPPGGPETVDALARLLGRSTDGAAAPLPTPETGVARIDNEVVATLLDTDTMESHVVTGMANSQLRR